MDHSDKDWIDILSFELQVEQVATLNKMLPKEFRFVAFEDSMKKIARARGPRQLNSHLGRGKLSMAGKRPAGYQNDNSFGGYSTPMNSSRPQSIIEKEPSVNPYQESLDLLEKLKGIFKQDFPDLEKEFDAGFLETCIKKGYYTDVEELKVGAKQVFRALANKHKHRDFSRT